MRNRVDFGPCIWRRDVTDHLTHTLAEHDHLLALGCTKSGDPGPKFGDGVVLAKYAQSDGGVGVNIIVNQCIGRATPQAMEGKHKWEKWRVGVHQNGTTNVIEKEEKENRNCE